MESLSPRDMIGSWHFIDQTLRARMKGSRLKGLRARALQETRGRARCSPKYVFRFCRIFMRDEHQYKSKLFGQSQTLKIKTLKLNNALSRRVFYRPRIGRWVYRESITLDHQGGPRAQTNAHAQFNFSPSAQAACKWKQNESAKSSEKIAIR